MPAGLNHRSPVEDPVVLRGQPLGSDEQRLWRHHADRKGITDMPD
jgi:hypothetical protein